MHDGDGSGPTHRGIEGDHLRSIETCAQRSNFRIRRTGISSQSCRPADCHRGNERRGQPRSEP